MYFSCKKEEFGRFFDRLDRPVEESRPDRFPSLTCRPFVALPVTAALTIVVVGDIELGPSNYPAREGLRLPTYGLPTKEVAHP